MKNKKLLFGVLSGLVAFSAVLALGNVNHTIGFVNAEECGHTGTVEHYLANATTIEHWACCECHTAWADEAKTIVVRTVDKDQTRSSTRIQYANYFAEGSYGWEDNSVALYDATYGFAYKHTLTQAANQLYAEFYDTTLDFVTNTSYQLEVTNDTDAFLQARLLNADWSACGDVHINIQAGEKGILTIPSTVVASGTKPFVVRMHNNNSTAYTGTVTVSKPIPTKSAIDFAAALNALNMPKDFDGNTYFSYYVSTVKPLLAEIQAVYGSEIPAELADNYNKYNSIFYGDATHGYTTFGYGSHDVSTTTIDGVEFIKLSNFAADGTGQLSYQITNVSYSSNKYFMFRVYNPFDSEIRMVAHDNWSKWGSTKDQTFYLSPNSWATILLDKTGYGEDGDTIIGVMMFNALGNNETSNKELLLSPIVDYIYDYSELDNAVYGQANNETLKGVDGGNGLVITKKRSPEYGTVQVINDITAIMYPRVYLNGKNNNNTNSYTSVKFYVKNETNTTLWLSSDTFNWDIAEYQHQVQLGGVGVGEWAEFTMDAEHFYYGTDTYINIGPSDGTTLITGNVLVSAFVGVN